MAEVKVVPGMTVRELADTGGAPPTSYIQREEDRPVDAVQPPTPIPVVDLSRLFGPDGGDDDEAVKLRSALESWGLFQAIGHEMSVSFMDAVHNVARQCFQLPAEVKQKYRNLKYGKDFPEGFGSDFSATEDRVFNWSDRILLLVQPEDERKLDLWPEEITSFRDVLNEFSMKAKKIMEHVLMAMARVLQLNEDYFINQFGDRATASTRFNYYPCCSRPDLVLGLQPHSDNTVITIVLPDKDVEGLQVLKDGVWVKVPIIPSALLINTGDLMEIMSNGIFTSPVHRVMTNMEKERISIAVFYHLEPEKDLGPADELVNEMRPRLYKTIKTKDYIEVFYQHSTKGKRAIDWAKI